MANIGETFIVITKDAIYGIIFNILLPLLHSILYKPYFGLIFGSAKDCSIGQVRSGHCKV